MLHTLKINYLINIFFFFFFSESAEKLQSELRELRVQHYTLKEQHDDLKEKMKFFTKVSCSTVTKAVVLEKFQGAHKANGEKLGSQL